MSQLRSRLFAFAFFTTHKELFGLSYGRWLRIALFVAILISLTQLQWVLAAVLLVIRIILGIIYRWAKRNGYATFVPKLSTNPQDIHSLSVDEQLKLRVTGKVSSSDHEFDVLLRQASIWRTAMNEFVLMVERTSETYLYQFIKPQRIKMIKSGSFKFGRDEYEGIKVTYETDWSPQLLDVGLAYYVGGGDQEEHLKIDLYLTFGAEDPTAVHRLERTLYEAQA